MGFVGRAVRMVREVWEVVVRGEDHAIQTRMSDISRQIARLGEQRSHLAQEREEVALSQVRETVKRLQELEKKLTEAEDAAVNLVDQIAKRARFHMKKELDYEKEILELLQQEQRRVLNEAQASNPTTGVKNPQDYNSPSSEADGKK